MKKSLISGIFALSLPMMALAASDDASKTNAAGAALINKVTQGQLTVVQQFPAIGGLTGYVVKPKQGPGQQMIFYTDASANFIFVGNLINSQAENLTQAYTAQYITAAQAVAAYAGVDALHVVTQGEDKAAHKTYVFVDPDCSYCHLLYEKLQPYLTSGELQVRWVPVAIRPNSAGRSARILQADNKEAVLLLAKDESHFDMKTEQGSLDPLAVDAKDASVTKAYAQLKDNTDFFMSYFAGTPVLLFKDAQGKPMVIPGYLEGDALQKAINGMSKDW